LNPAVALLVEALEQLGIDLLLGRADQLGQLASLCDDHRHSIATDLQAPSDLSQRHALIAEVRNIAEPERPPSALDTAPDKTRNTPRSKLQKTKPFA
jgi:hypothetical protein